MVFYSPDWTTFIKKPNWKKKSLFKLGQASHCLQERKEGEKKPPRATERLPYMIELACPWRGGRAGMVNTNGKYKAVEPASSPAHEMPDNLV